MKTNRATNLGKQNPSESFRLFLQAELARRCKENPQYSLRAFAMTLEVDHASLSQILRGRRKLTPRSIANFGKQLGLDESTIQNFIAYELAYPGSTLDSTRAEVVQLSQDTAHLISDWQHFAILELLRLKDFEPSSRWIAQVLGITVDEVNVAITRLVRLKLMEMKSPTEWVDRTGDAVFDIGGFAHAAIHRLEEQVHLLSSQALSNSALEPQDHTVTTVAVTRSKLPQIIAAIARFRESMLATLSEDEPCDSVYQLEIRFFPISKAIPKGADHG